MQESQIEIYFDSSPLWFKLYIFFVFLIGKIGKYNIKTQKKKLILTFNIEPRERLNLIRKLFILNFFNVKKVVTTY